MIPRTFSEEMMIVGPRFNRKPAEILEYWNRGALELYGWTVEEALGSVVYDLLKTVFSVSLEQIEEDVVQHPIPSGYQRYDRFKVGQRLFDQTGRSKEALFGMVVRRFPQRKPTSEPTLEEVAAVQQQSRRSIVND